MLSWSDSPFTNCSSGVPSPGTGVALYEFERSKLYSVGLKSTVITSPFAAPSSTVIVAFLSCTLLIARSRPASLALDADAPLDATDHVVRQSVHERRVEARNLRGHRAPGARSQPVDADRSVSRARR